MAMQPVDHQKAKQGMTTSRRKAPVMVNRTHKWVKAVVGPAFGPMAVRMQNEVGQREWDWPSKDWWKI